MDMDVSKNRGTPKWMVYNGKPYQSMDDLGGKPTIFGNTHIHRTFSIPVGFSLSMGIHPFVTKACFGNHEADVGLPALKKRLERWHERPSEAGALNVCVYVPGSSKGC